jgi:hypothetical protein
VKFWLSRSKKYPGGKTFGKAHSAVQNGLEARGWVAAPLRTADSNEALTSDDASLVFMQPKCMIFSVCCSSGVRLRQFSEACAQHLDDKRDLCINVVAADQGAILPKTYPVISRGIIEQLLLAEDPVQSKAKCAQPHWFLKHRLDSVRPRVHPFATVGELKGKLEDIGEKAWPWYVLQQEVWPPLLLHGRKFVLRAHVLLHRKPGEKLRVYLHSSPVVMEHDQPFDFGAASDACEVLVLQHAVKRAERPKPYLLNDVPALYTKAFGALREVVLSSVQAVEGKMEASSDNSGGGSSSDYYYQLCGYDLMLDEEKRLYLLEVNKSPIIANGPVLVELKEMYAVMVLGILELLLPPAASRGSAGPTTGIGSSGWERLR